MDELDHPTDISSEITMVTQSINTNTNNESSETKSETSSNSQNEAVTEIKSKTESKITSDTLTSTKLGPKLQAQHYESMYRQSKCLRKLGVSEDDVKRAEVLFAQMIPFMPGLVFSTKPEQFFGYAATRLQREKALRLLGVSEDEVELENTKCLSSLGLGARRRSYLRPRSFYQMRELPKRRFSTILAGKRRFIYFVTSCNGKQVTRRRHSTGNLYGPVRQPYTKKKSIIIPSTSGNQLN